MKVAYVFSTSGHTASDKLGTMILPQLEEGRHGAEVSRLLGTSARLSAYSRGMSKVVWVVGSGAAA